MNKGGYQILDFRNIPFESGGSGFVIEGIYDLIEGTKKLLLLSGVVINGVEHRDQYISVRRTGSKYQIDLYVDGITYYIHIQDNDIVNIDITSEG